MSDNKLVNCLNNFLKQNFDCKKHFMISVQILSTINKN